MHAATYEDPGKWLALALALLMHALLAGALLFSVKWQTRSQPVVAELWSPSQLPAPPEPPPPVETTAAEPVTPPPPKPVEPTRPPPEIKLKPEKKAKEAKEKPPVDPPKTKSTAFSELLAREETRLDRRKVDLEQQRRVEEEARMLKEAREEGERLQRNLVRAKAEADYIARLRGKIRGNLVQPPNLKGNPVAEFVVSQLPSGEVLEVKLRRASGNPLYDDAVERAIRKSSPLPKPNDVAVFSRDLVLTFCPDEERGCAR